jgi:hypothetical protein
MKLAAMQFAHRLVERLKQIKALGGDACFDHAAIIGLAFTSDEIAFFHAVEEAGDVRVMRNHAFAYATAGEAMGFSAAKNPQDVILRAGETGGFD